MSDDPSDPRSGDDTTDVHRPDEAEVEALLSGMSDPTRMEIVLALIDAVKREEGPIPFSELRDRVGERDSGRFNYHLDALLGGFAERTDEGYRLLDDPGPEGFRYDPEAVPDAAKSGDDGDD